MGFVLRIEEKDNEKSFNIPVKTFSIKVRYQHLQVVKFGGPNKNMRCRFVSPLGLKIVTLYESWFKKENSYGDERIKFGVRRGHDNGLER